MASAKSGSQPATDPLVAGLTSNVAGLTSDGLAPDLVQARRRAILAGHSGNIEVLTALVRHPEPPVRIAALGALAGCGNLETSLIVEALEDTAWPVRRRACELAGRLATPRRDHESDETRAGMTEIGSVFDQLVSTLADGEPLVAEAAAWALGELAPIVGDGPVDCVGPLMVMTTNHSDPLCREAAVAALGAIGASSSLDSVLCALEDKPPIRRRATIALAAFADPRADEALRRCLGDRDWQVRQAAEDILGRMD